MSSSQLYSNMQRWILTGSDNRSEINGPPTRRLNYIIIYKLEKKNSKNTKIYIPRSIYNIIYIIYIYNVLRVFIIIILFIFECQSFLIQKSWYNNILPAGIPIRSYACVERNSLKTYCTFETMKLVWSSGCYTNNRFKSSNNFDEWIFFEIYKVTIQSKNGKKVERPR